MAASHERAQRGADPSGVSLVSISASPGADGVVVLAVGPFPRPGVRAVACRCQRRSSSKRPGRHGGDGAADGFAVGAPASGRQQRCPRRRAPGAGRGSQPYAEVCRAMVDRGFTGTVVREESTQRARTRSRCALRRKPRHSETTKTAPRTTVLKTGSLANHRRRPPTTSLSSRRTARLIQIDLPQPRSEGSPT